MIVSLVVNHLSSQFMATQSALAFLYGEYGRKDEQTNEGLLASLILQVAEYQAPLHDVINSLFARCKELKRRPTYDELSPVFGIISKGFDRVFLIIDAPDQCRLYVRKQLIGTIRR